MKKVEEITDNKSTYKPLEIEKKWKEKWEKDKVYAPDLDTAKKPFYNLMMFPYPSAEGLHVGSVFTFTGVDTYGRFKRMQGYDVFQPMGLDGFGIHSENYALKVGRHPIEQAKRSEENFYRQLSSVGNGFDWSRKLETYDPQYYKWTQWIFIQLFKQGLAYRKKAPVNFCPSCKTVLSDEQVIDGKCERCSSIVEKRDLEQWFFKITDYAERLLNNIPDLQWTNKVKIAQEQWIGKSQGANVTFALKNVPGQPDLKHKVDIFTTRPDTLFGATFLAISPELGKKWLDVGWQATPEVVSYITTALKADPNARKEEKREKTGVNALLLAVNPVNNEEIAVWIADYVLADYGTGALFGDAHDERDVEFAKKYGVALKPTLATGDKEKDERIMNLEEVFTGYGTLVNSGEFTGLASHAAMEKIIPWLEKKGAGSAQTTYHLRDWLISRQRYWGPPIPMIFCEKCEWQPVPEDQLPVLLPNVEDWKPKGEGTSPLANIPEFVDTTCPKCGGKARRETDVSDTFLDSAWYFFRYISTECNDEVFSKERAKKWLPVTMYIGGAEHSVLHLLYSRFITMVFKDMGLIDFEEPYARFYAHGLIIKDGAKMSKSKGNVINPDEYLAKYGVDTLRAYLRFVGPFDMGGDFRDSGIEGMEKFLKRVWKLFQTAEEGLEMTAGDKRMMHAAVKGITEDMESLRFNTVIAKLMIWYNYLSGKEKTSREEAQVFVTLLAPVAPFVAEELWEKLGGTYSVHTAPWPMYDAALLEQNELTVVVQVNGKVRESMQVQSSKIKDQSYIEELAREKERVKMHLEGKSVKKVIYVSGKVINFVV